MSANLFYDYDINVEITVRRKDGQYGASTALANVSSHEQVSMRESEVHQEVERVVSEAHRKVAGNLNIRHRFELDTRALEAGDTIIEG